MKLKNFLKRNQGEVLAEAVSQQPQVQIATLVRDFPGITIQELSEKLGKSDKTLYPSMGKLLEQQLIRKGSKGGYYPTKKLESEVLMSSLVVVIALLYVGLPYVRWIPENIQNAIFLLFCGTLFVMLKIEEKSKEESI